MNCFYHENIGAVATCVDCGVGLCKDCVQNALYTRDNKAICLNCSKKEAGAQASNAKGEDRWLSIQLVYLAVFFVVGLYVYYTAENRDTAGLAMIGTWCVANILKIFVGTFTSLAGETHDALMLHTNAGGWWLIKIIKLAVLGIFWGLFLPIQIVWVAFKLIKAKKQASLLHQNQDIANSINM